MTILARTFLRREVAQKYFDDEIVKGLCFYPTPSMEIKGYPDGDSYVHFYVGKGLGLRPSEKTILRYKRLEDILPHSTKAFKKFLLKEGIPYHGCKKG